MYRDLHETDLEALEILRCVESATAVHRNSKDRPAKAKTFEIMGIRCSEESRSYGATGDCDEVVSS
jgi:hypothetical protein